MNFTGYRAWKLAVALLAWSMVLIIGAFGNGTQMAGAAARSASKGVKPTIAWIQIGANNPFWTAENKAAVTAGKRDGFNVRILSGNTSVSTQSAEIEQLANEHVSVILLTAIDPAANISAIKYAEARKVPVVSLYSTSSAATMSAGFDEKAVGHDMAVFSADLLKQRYGKVKGTVAVLGLALGQTLEKYRIGGFVATMKKYPGVHVVSTQPTTSSASKAQSVMQDWLTKYPHLSLVYGGSDTVTVPALTIAKRTHRVCSVPKHSWKKNPNCIIFTSVDGDPIGIASIEKGTLAGTDLYAPYWAGWQFAMIGDRLATHKIKPHTMVFQALPVDKKNVACITKMQTAMAKRLSTFNFTGSLAQIAKKFGCAKVTISGGPRLKGGEQF